MPTNSNSPNTKIGNPNKIEENDIFLKGFFRDELEIGRI